MLSWKKTIKQADFLSRSLVKVDPKELRDLHLIISSISRPEHLTLFELGIATKVDFSFAGPRSLRLAQLLEDGKIEIGAIHTYVELYARLLIDLIPNVVWSVLNRPTKKAISTRDRTRKTRLSSSKRRRFTTLSLSCRSMRLPAIATR